MKQVLVVTGLVLAVSVGAAVAAAGGAKERPAWTVSKAERLVQSGATVSLAPEDRAALERELMRAVSLYQPLEVPVSLGGDAEPSVYPEGFYTYTRALGKVRAGLKIDAADCKGSGVSVSGRFTAFRCNVTSESLQIPSTELVVQDDGRISVEGKPRSIGPIDAQFTVRVKGKSSFALRKV